MNDNDTLDLVPNHVRVCADLASPSSLLARVFHLYLTRIAVCKHRK